MGLIAELRRRNVLRMALLYVLAAWVVMQVAGVLIDLSALPAAAGLWVLAVLVIGFPIALVFSWLFEITPEGLALEKDVPEGASITHITGRRMDFIVIAVLSAGLILFAYDKWWVPAPAETSIAVMAFENMSGDPEQEYFSDGISEELLNVLAQIPELRVISRSSAFSFKGKDIATPAVAEQLSVDYVLEGSVRRDGNLARITAQLIEASSDSHLWSSTFDRDLDDILAVQEEISTTIVGALTAQLGLRVEAAPRVTAPANNEAHDAYLRGRYLAVQPPTPTTVLGAIREFEKALEFDPDYALVHAELATATLRRTLFGDGLPLGEAIDIASRHAEQALALDPTLAEAHFAAGYLLWTNSIWTNSDFEESLVHFRRAIEINPNYSMVYSWMGSQLGDYVGHYAEAFAAQETALRLDPLSVQGRQAYVWSLIERNRLEDADRELEKLVSIAPGFYANMRGYRTAVGGEWANAAIGSLDALEIDTDHPLWRQELIWGLVTLGLDEEVLAFESIPHFYEVLILNRMGRTEDAAAAAEFYSELELSSPLDQKNLGLALAGAGDYDRARPLLEEAWQQSGGSLTHFGVLQNEHVAALAVIRRDAGEEVAELIEAMNDSARRRREAGVITNWPNGLYPGFGVDYHEGLAAFLAGKRERGLELIAKAVEEGLFVPPGQAYLQSLYDDPEFAPIWAIQESRQIRERDRFLAIVCNDNPYDAVWKPAEGTCERFAPADGW